MSTSYEIILFFQPQTSGVFNDSSLERSKCLDTPVIRLVSGASELRSLRLNVTFPPNPPHALVFKDYLSTKHTYTYIIL